MCANHMYYHMERDPYLQKCHLANRNGRTCQMPWKAQVVMTPTLSSLAASRVIIMTTSGATSDDKVDMTTLDFFSGSVDNIPHA